jgi:1-deoxy-D-xylulose-5-phosphate synthase
MRFIKPLDTALIAQIAQTHTAIVTVEENALAGGAGSAVNEVLIKLGYRGAVLNLGLPDSFIEHGEHAALLSELQLDAPGILAQIQTWQAKS